MMPKPNIQRYLLLFTAFAILAIFSGDILKKFVYTGSDQGSIQRQLNRKYALLDDVVADFKTRGGISDPKKADKKGIILLAYKKDSLVYWSSNGISILAMHNLQHDTSRFSFISNTWYIIRKYAQGDTVITGLLKIKHEYPYQNEFLRNAFQRDLHIPYTTQISLTPKDSDLSLLDWENKVLFSLVFDGALKYPWLVRYLPPIFYLFTLLLFLVLITGLFKRIPEGPVKNILFLLLVLFLFASRALQVKYVFPGAIYNLELFGPFLFAKAFMPSLGDVLLNSILIIFLIIRFRSDFYYGRSPLTGKSWKTYSGIFLPAALLAAYFIFSHYIFSSLILNSSINFETFKVTGLTVYTFIGLLVVALHLTGLLLLADHILTMASGKMPAAKLILIFTLVYGTGLLLLYLGGYSIDLVSFAGFFVFFLVLALIHYHKPISYNYSALLVFVFLFAVFSVYFISRCTGLKEKNNMKVLAEKLTSEHDPVAEYLLEGLDKKIVNDTVLAGYLFNLDFSFEDIFNHLQDNYFKGFWGKYSLRFTDCRPSYKLLVNAGQNCYEFFNEIIQERGDSLSNTNFYFIDTINGRINYLGRIKYESPDGKEEVTLFIELESRLISEELGYPKLLIEEKYSPGSSLHDYSYAKYHKDSLISQEGIFQYSLMLDNYEINDFSAQGYDHLVFAVDKYNTIIVSKASTTYFTRLVSFSYIFVFYYLLVMIFILFRYLTTTEKNIVFNFKNKIQFSILSVLLLSLILIGGGTIYFTVEQYRKKQYDILSEKIQSVYIEIDHKLAYVTPLTTDWSSDSYDNLGQLLQKLSDVFYTDINLYDPAGNLLATSRPEIFERGLQGEKMNPVAYHKLTGEKQAEFVNRESIGNLFYLSAYVPYLNAENKLMAYLNLPYFTKQDVLSKDISTLTVAIINVYVLLILMTIAIAVFISEQITKPLRMIQQKFSEIKLGKQYEVISYRGKDEIGNLVAEYNRMVGELERSVEMLAKSERESAWREMAKQIAHEIKNPLTPMKLSVQQLQKAWQDKTEDFDRHLERITRTLVEQIDDLSKIASEFSNFAKMPKAVNERINLAERIRHTLDLFSNTENVNFSFACADENICVMADKEHISRVFINLIKNAIQSIPDNKPGNIKLKLEKERQKAVFTITDNGKGIPAELLDKMFTPNFTTKSSGMGMGLAIVKNIVETCNGSITFHTDTKRGTTFTVEMPLCTENK